MEGLESAPALRARAQCGQGLKLKYEGGKEAD